MDVALPFLRHASKLDIVRVGSAVLFVVIFGLENHRPAGREDTVVCIELIRLEEEAPKDRIDGQTLSIG
jgi:hypothetical protein